MFWTLVLLSTIHTVLGTGCNTPLGVGTENVRVDCSSSIKTADTCKFAGIYTQDAWCGNKVDTYQFLQVTFPSENHITKISIRGDPKSGSYTSYFMIAYPDPLNSGKTVFVYENNDRKKLKRFKANTNPSSIVSVDLDLSTKVLFLIPYRWEPTNRACLSFELYGCNNGSIMNYCATKNGGCEQICINSVSGSICSCKIGYQTNGKSCQDIDECTSSPSKCNETTSVCKNSPGSYTCNCKLGFKEDASTGKCFDIDECAGDPNLCTLPNKKCVNVPGSYQCLCIAGYTDGPNGTCVDIDECTSPANKCNEATSVCKNNPGSYTCECKQGFERDASTDYCLDINECQDPAVCNSTSNSLCVNTFGSYQCKCENGFQVGGSDQCVEVNECLQNPCNTSVSKCKNTIGSFQCPCIVGFQKDKDNKCVDVDECAGTKDPCSSVPNLLCVNTVGSYECNCRYGFIRKPVGTCEDIDECQREPVLCDLTKSTCVNLPGTYECKCNNGYKKDASGTCQAECPQGQYYNATTQDCKQCPVGSYQDLTGQSFCKECPTGTGTRFEGATSSENCSRINDKCLPGFFSPDGFNRAGAGSCRKCLVGSYQPEEGQTSCKPCPMSASTKQEGSTMIDECVLAAHIFKEEPSSRLIQAKERDTIEFGCYAYGIPLPRVTIKNSTALLPAILRGAQKLTMIHSTSPYITGIKLQITSVTIADSASYDCVAENNFGTEYNTVRKTFNVDVSF